MRIIILNNKQFNYNFNKEKMMANNSLKSMNALCLFS